MPKFEIPCEIRRI